MEWKITECNISDLLILSKVYSEAYNKSTWNEKWDNDLAYCRLSELLASPNVFSFVCRVNETIAGAVFFELLTWHTGKQMEIKELFVLPDVRGKGIGKALLKSAEKYSSSRGALEGFLWTSTCDVLHKFYNGNGYSRNNDVVQLSKIILEE